MAKKKAKKPIGAIDIIILLLIVVGIGVLAYPFVSDAYVSYKNQQVIDAYQVRETKKNTAALKREYKQYQAKNTALAKTGAAPGVAAFNTAVNAQGTAKTSAKRDQQTLTNDTIAQLTIPTIGVSLPVFSRTTDWLLQFGACLLDGTSYPTGGKNTHAVISAHRGIPNAELFTRLPELKNGAKFFIKIGDKTLAYQVFKRQTIDPSDIGSLKVEPGQDLVTLMTCTPYMINSHRLLITGRRVPYTKADKTASNWAERWNKLKLAAWGLAGILLLGVIWLLLRGLLVAGSRYELRVTALTADGAALADASLVVRRRRKHVATLTTGPDGVASTTLRGGTYRVEVPAGVTSGPLKAYVKHWHDKQFTLKPRHH
ncbi:class C sortase [Lacticaseibacillus yichunensis]|uniref:Class C sortase n=1 Tax=Lacticaseibacillus yichunensis TaxID=2486015 RepID=A0ABW4CMM3_9LACO|nr:class C sortase [Lacticaseibacillus yichunensis]